MILRLYDFKKRMGFELWILYQERISVSEKDKIWFPVGINE